MIEGVTKLWRSIFGVGRLVIPFVPDSLSLGTNHIVLLPTNGWSSVGVRNEQMTGRAHVNVL